MKHPIKLFIILALFAIFATTDAKKRIRKPGHKQGHRKVHVIPDASVYNENDLNEISVALNEIDTADDLNFGIEKAPKYYDPCTKRHCSPGQLCVITEDGEPMCICISECPSENDPRRKVCSNFNQTWGSDCELHQMRCWCEIGDERCSDSNLAHHHIDYYGLCKEIEECTKDQMLDFPRRMRDWLFHVMRDMADREELNPYYLKMERIAETNHTKKWTTAAVWKWCDLDTAHDRSVSRHELFPIRAHLVAMEHCIAPFLDSCDSNGDHKITLEEWVHCLELDEEEIEEKCEDIRDN